MTIGQRMKSRRKELGMSAEDVAKKLGKHPATVYRYENGDIENMPTNILYPIAEALNTTPAWLMGWEEKEISPAKPELSEGEKMMLALFRRIPEDRQSEALELLRVALKMQKKL